MGSLSAEQILAAKDVVIRDVEIPEWGGKVYVRNLTGDALDSFYKSLVRKDGKGEVVEDLSRQRLKLLVRAMCDAGGERLFQDGQIDALAQKSGVILDRIYQQAANLNKIDAESKSEVSKNSEPASGSDSNTA